MRPRAFTSRFPPPASRGFTLAEIVVALVLLAWGALALVAASAGAVRAVGAAEAQERATAAARDRVELLAARDCSSLRDGSSIDSAHGVQERWTVTPIRNGARLLTASVEYTDRGAAHGVVLKRLIVC
ncbi:MAG: hypothetical protein M3282_00920 [Gemmatimonadota bacterium]|nr:hypothetical protein [Gemmatimonadota bacterium]